MLLCRLQMRAELDLPSHPSDDMRPSLISSSGGEHAGRDGGVPRRLEALPGAARGRPPLIQGPGGKDLHPRGAKRLRENDLTEDGQPAHRAERRGPPPPPARRFSPRAPRPPAPQPGRPPPRGGLPPPHEPPGQPPRRPAPPPGR